MADQKTRSLVPLGKFTDPAASGYLNCLHATIISLWTFFAENYWVGDMSRVIYASNDYAFKRRVELNAAANTQGLNLPFQNFKITNVMKGTQRPWFNHEMAIQGYQDYTIGKRIKLIPVTINFESTLFFSTEADAMWLQQKLLWDASLETKIKPSVDLSLLDPLNPLVPKVTTLDMIGVIGMEPSYNPQFTENDWLEKNKIRTATLDNLNIQLLMTNDDIRTATYALSKTIILKVYEMSETETFANELLDLSFILADFP